MGRLFLLQAWLDNPGITASMLASITICKPENLSQASRQKWCASQKADPALNSPFLHPDFVLQVAKTRTDVRVLEALDNQNNHAWFAFHHRNGGLVRPVGTPVSDYQAIIMEPGFSARPEQILKEAGISALPFSAILNTKDHWTQHSTHYENSHILDLDQGSDHYFAAQQKNHRRYFKKMRQRARNMVRDFGEGELVVADNEPELWQQLRTWKHDQFTRTGKLDVLNVPWIATLLDNLYMQSGGDGMQAKLFGYRINGEWAAAEFGLLADGVYHSWIAAYGDQYAKVSPGMLLLHGIIEAAKTLQIKQIDLGRGHEHYKKYYASRMQPLYAGCVVGKGPAAAQRKIVYAICDGFGKLPLGKLARLPGRIAGSLDYIGACHPNKTDQIKAFGGTLHRMLRKSP